MHKRSNYSTFIKQLKCHQKVPAILDDQSHYMICQRDLQQLFNDKKTKRKQMHWKHT